MPRLDGIEKNGSSCPVSSFPLVHGGTPSPGYLGDSRLNFARFIRAAGLEHGFFSAPIPGKPKPGPRLSMYRLLKLGVLPCPAAVGGYFDPADGAGTGPSYAGNLVKSASGQPLFAGRKSDDRFSSKLGI